MRIARALVPTFGMALLLTSLPAVSHAQDVSLGVLAGASLSTFTGNFPSDVKQHAGFIAGAFVHLGFGGFAIQPGVYYVTKGADSTGLTGATQTSRQTLDYIEVPLVLRLHLPFHLYVGAGPAVGFKIGCKIGSGNALTDCANITGPDPKSTEISGIAEAGFHFGHFSLGGRADLGLSDVFNQPVSNITVRTRTVSAIAAIRF